jgi:predicted RNase H-like HicB family nuclease
MPYYFGILDGKDDVWGVRVPDLPGAYGAGTTADEAMVSAAEAMSIVTTHLREAGKDIPPARSVAELRGDPEITADLAPNDSFIALPLVIETGKPMRANISLDAGMLEAIDAAAKRRGVTRSAYLVSAAKQKILAEG